VLDNALEHTPPGGRIWIAVQHQAQQGVLVIEDNGDGIPSEHLPRIFDRFHRVDPSRSRKTGGVGLGLAIAHRLVTAHGGHISISNRPDGGTRVSIALPLAPADEVDDFVESLTRA
jgi:signal transduction histidine kinase